MLFYPSYVQVFSVVKCGFTIVAGPASSKPLAIRDARWSARRGPCLEIPSPHPGLLGISSVSDAVHQECYSPAYLLEKKVLLSVSTQDLIVFCQSQYHMYPSRRWGRTACPVSLYWH